MILTTQNNCKTWKTTFFVFIFCISSLVSSSQINIGVNGGFNTISFGGYEQFKGIPEQVLSYGIHRPYPFFGIEISDTITHKLFFCSGVNYITKGTDFEAFYPNRASTNGYIRLKYLEIPLSFNFQILKRYSLGVGPFVGFYLFGKYKELMSITTTGILDQNKKIETASPVSYGINVDNRITFDRLTVELRWSKNLGKQLVYNKLYYDNNIKQTTSVSISIIFQIFKQ